MVKVSYSEEREGVCKKGIMLILRKKGPPPPPPFHTHCYHIALKRDITLIKGIHITYLSLIRAIIDFNIDHPRK